MRLYKAMTPVKEDAGLLPFSRGNYAMRPRKGNSSTKYYIEYIRYYSVTIRVTIKLT